jgi:PKD repeat protein
VSGKAQISAFSGSARAAALELTVGGAAATQIVLSATPSSVSASGGTVQILATVLDAAGNRIPGVSVAFASTAGSLSQSSAITDGNGEARTQLTTTREASVTATAGAAATATLTVPVASRPTVSITAPQPLTAGQTAQFGFAVSAQGAAIRQLAINFGDGERLTLTSPADSTTVVHTYAEAGTYTITATVTDVSGESSTDTEIIQVQPPASLTITNFIVPDPAIVNTPGTFAVTVQGDTNPSRISAYEWDFGDGTVVRTNSTSTSHVYTAAGVKVVRVTVITTDGDRFTAQKEIFVRAI